MTPTAMTVTAQTPSLPLASFYNAEGHIVWPADAPTAGDLKEKRSDFDQASQVVLAELKKNGVASIATVTDARQKLLDYGRPACNMSANTKPLAWRTPTTCSCCRFTSRWPRPSIPRHRPQPCRASS